MPTPNEDSIRALKPHQMEAILLAMDRNPKSSEIIGSYIRTINTGTADLNYPSWLRRAANTLRHPATPVVRTRSIPVMNSSGHMEIVLESDQRPRVNIRDGKRRGKKRQQMERLEHAGAPLPTSASPQQPLPSLTPRAAGPSLAPLLPPTLRPSPPGPPSPAAGPSPASRGRGSPARRSRGAYRGTAAPKPAAEADEQQICVNCGAKYDPDESEMGECSKHPGAYGWSCKEDGGFDHWSNSRQGAPEGKKSWVCCGKEDADATGCVPWTHTTETEEKRVHRMKEQKEK
ncbi:hypothetical protein DL767_011103 [Monosporascus sp. MG133]|nr:hypothetical protein DL767_011103 [Monosporascus sp. MG133]